MICKPDHVLHQRVRVSGVLNSRFAFYGFPMLKDRSHLPVPLRAPARDLAREAVAVAQMPLLVETSAKVCGRAQRSPDRWVLISMIVSKGRDSGSCVPGSRRSSSQWTPPQVIKVGSRAFATSTR